MNVNENLVKKQKNTDDDYVEEVEDFDEESTNEEDDNEEEKVSNGNGSSKFSNFGGDSAKKNLMKMMAFIMAIALLIILILFILSLFTKKKYDYGDIEEILVNAAEGYFKDYPDSLPVNDGDIVEIDSSNLVVAGKMKDLSTYLKDGVTCSGTVQVEKSGSEYLYTPFLNCGDNYSTIELHKKILNEEEIVTSGDGLYSRGGSYYFRGEYVNNYVKMDNSLWRIVKVTSDDNIVLIHANGLDYSQPWDNRYNESMLYEAGINNYPVSRMKEYLERIYKDPVVEDGEDILSKKDKSKLVNYNVCIGKRSIDSEEKDNSLECKEVLKEQKIGLLTLSDYLYASLDPNCKSASTRSCMNYNYLSIDDEWWLITANSQNTATAYMVNRDGVVEANTTADYSKIRPVVYLNSKVLLKKGKGTEKDPYILK